MIQKVEYKIIALNLILKRANIINIKHVRTMNNLKKFLKILDIIDLSHTNLDRVIVERNLIRSHIRVTIEERNFDKN